MPEIARFYGIIIRMFFDDHNPPHFHVQYGDDEALYDIRTLGIFAGSLPPKAQSLVVEWASIHQDELLECWHQASNHQTPERIEPLK